MMPNKAQIAAFRSLLFKDLGIIAQGVLAFKEELVELTNVEISPNLCGLMAPLVSEAVVNVQYGMTRGGILIVKYSYLIDVFGR